MTYLATFICQKKVNRSLESFPQTKDDVAVVGNWAGVHHDGSTPDSAESVSFTENLKRNASHRSVQATIDLLLHEGSQSSVRVTKKRILI